MIISHSQKRIMKRFAFTKPHDYVYLQRNIVDNNKLKCGGHVFNMPGKN